MNLNNKKLLASKVLGVGINKIILDSNRLEEIGEAITKQDIRDLYDSGAIKIRDNFGRKTKNLRKTKRKNGKIKKDVAKRKENYRLVTRKLRAYVKELLRQRKITKDKHIELRKKIKARAFKSKGHLKEIGELK
jgi:large subunit ribosomal protein L19e